MIESNCLFVQFIKFDWSSLWSSRCWFEWYYSPIKNFPNIFHYFNSYFPFYYLLKRIRLCVCVCIFFVFLFSPYNAVHTYTHISLSINGWANYVYCNRRNDTFFVARTDLKHNVCQSKNPWIKPYVHVPGDYEENNATKYNSETGKP